jgi:hemoglobin
MQSQSPYQILGDEGISELADTFYEVMDSAAEFAAIRGLHAENMDSIKRKLCAYLTGWMGGPPVYQAMTGTVCLTDVHAPFAIGPHERDLWLDCMREALQRVGASDELLNLLTEPLYRVAEAVRNTDASRAGDPDIIAVGRR